MCGINGIFAYHYAANPVDEAELVATRDHMRARGPDGAGLWLSPDRRTGFGHRRLAIIDLSERGAQPMATADGRYVVTFNGEIYNHSDLRRTLEARGCVFRSSSDTEVLLHLYAWKGADMVHDLRGMFAFAIWDRPRNMLFLARDPMGIKPLYYSDDGWTFRFASQVKALLAGGKLHNDPDPAGIVGFWLWGSIPEPFTTHRAIRSLPAGCHLTVGRLGAPAPFRWHSIARLLSESGPERKRPPFPDLLREAVGDSVRAHLTADVPVGAFLSSGIDSSAIVGVAAEAGRTGLRAVTMAFDDSLGTEADERTIAAATAQHYGASHAIEVVGRGDFAADFPAFMAAMDQPTIDGVNTWFVAKASARAGLKVALSGVGGDELLGGYPSFTDVPRWVRWLSIPSRLPFLPLANRALLASPIGRRWTKNPKVAGLATFGGTYLGAYQLRRGMFLPWELDFLDADLVQEGLRRLANSNYLSDALSPCPPTSFARVAALEMQVYMRNQLLRDTDWTSMAHGLEVRTPLVDSTLLSTLAPHLSRGWNGIGKQALAAAPALPLPDSVRLKKKTGFTVPIATWQTALTDRYRGHHAQRVGDKAKQWPWARRWALSVADAQGMPC